MTITIIHGGQTGVDRGAWRGAADSGLMVSGYAPSDWKDEPASPDVVLELVARVRELEARVEQADAHAGANTMKAGQFDRIRTFLDAAGVPRTNPNASPGYESMTTEQRVVWLISQWRQLVRGGAK